MATQVNIGKIVATAGVKGELVLVHSLGKKADLKNVETVFVGNKPESLLPYFTQSAKARTDTETVVKVEGIDTPEQARTLLKQSIWLNEDDFNKHVAKSAAISMLGYLLVDVDKEIGEITEVIEQPHQILCAVDYQGKEVLVPVHEDNLIKIDNKAKKVFVELPDGLLEIYE